MVRGRSQPLRSASAKGRKATARSDCWKSLVRHGSQHIGIACKHPFSVLLLEDRQGVARTRHGLSAAGRGDHDGEFRPHKGPVPENLDLLNLACAVELGGLLAELRPCRNGEVAFPPDRLARTQQN